MEWRHVKEFPGYSINNLGEIQNFETHRMVRSTKNQRDILKVGLRRNGKQHWRSVAVLVAQSFLPEPEEVSTYPTVIHLDGNRENVSVDNLAWRSRSFALAYHKQFLQPPILRIKEPIIHVDSGLVFEDSFHAATTFGMLEHTVAKMVYRSESDRIHIRDDATFRRLSSES